MSTIATRFREILTGLRAAIGMHLDKDRARDAIFVLVWHRIGRMANRFDALFAKWQAGTLPKPRPSRPGRTGKPRDPQLRLPQGRVWLVAAVGYHAAGRAGQLQHLFTDPDFDKFLQAVPQAGRILRPLCHMLGIDPPAPLRLPPRPRTVAPRKPRPPKAPPLQPEHPIYPVGFRSYPFLKTA